MTNTPLKRQLTWPEIETTLAQLAEKLLPHRHRWDKLIAVARGGLVPAGILSYKLEIPFVDTICLRSYDGTDQQGVTVLKPLELTGSDCLVIDELVDTGETAKVLRTMLPDCTIATLYAKPEGQPHVNHFVEIVPQTQWLDFPWDQPHQKP